MYVIGISSGLKHGHHDGSAVLLKDGKIIAASEEERFTLAKHARGELPKGAIKFCLKKAGITLNDVDWICSPLATYKHYDKRLEEYFKYHFGHSPKIQLFNHHLCHAASSYYASGFDEATVIGFDFSGDSSSGLVAVGEGSALKPQHFFPRTNSLGLYYGMLTQYLGYQMTHDEYKVMGLASYGTPKYQEEFKKILYTEGDYYALNPKTDKRMRDAEIFTTDFSTRQERIFTEEWESILGPRRLGHDAREEKHADIAASGQAQLEEVAKHVVRKAIAKTGKRKVCLTGGVALNVKMNMEIARLPEVDAIYVPPVPHDAGVSLGAAMLKCVELGYAIEPVNHAYFGPEYSSSEIHHTLKQIGASFEEVDDPETAAAADLEAGNIIGWFQDRMEYGPRALGNRSILSDPRSLAVKDRINATIKYREEYRPFCPSVLMEKQNDFFEDTFESPFMTVNFKANPTAKDVIPAVVHVDETARIQSVNKLTNPKFHRLISLFEKQTGVPLLVNTSLNINEQPTVKAPIEALHTYFCSGLDKLYLGNFRLSKK